MDLLNEIIITKINNAKVDTYPFKHFIIPNFLPAYFYNELVEKNSKLTTNDCINFELDGIGLAGWWTTTREKINEALTIFYNMDNIHMSSIHKEIHNAFPTSGIYNIQLIFNYSCIIIRK